MHRRGDLPVVKEGGALESESVESRPRPNQSNRLILPSISALEHNLLKLLEECDASGIQNLVSISDRNAALHSSIQNLVSFFSFFCALSASA